jgi:PAS domain S-box-containing protein
VTEEARTRRSALAVLPGTSMTIRDFSRLLSIVAGAIGVGGVTAWLLGTPEPISALTGSSPIRPNTGLSLVLLSIASTLLVTTPPRIRAAGGLALGTLGIVSIAVLEPVTGLGFDRLFVLAAPPNTPPEFQHAMLPATALGLWLVALGVLTHGRHRTIHLSQAFHFGAAVIAGLTLVGAWYALPELSRTQTAFGISLGTTIALLLLSVAGIAADSRHGIVQQLIDRGPGGRVARRMLPAALVVIPVVGWLRLLGERAGLYDREAAVVVMVAVQAVILVVIAMWTVAGVNRLERDRRRVERERDRFFELSSDLMAVLDEEGRVISASPSSAALLGSAPAALRGRSLADFAAPDNLEVVRTGLSANRVFESQWRHPDGSLRWIEWSLERDEETGRTYGIGRDVTERKEVADAASRLAAIVASSSDAIIGLDLDGRVQTWNAAASGIFGYTLGDAIGSPLDHMARAGDSVPAPSLDAAARGTAQNLAFTARRRDGSEFPAEMTLFPVRAPEGAIVGLSAIVRDVSTAHEARVALERYAEDLSRSNAELEQFAYVASHDLQEPLRMVTGFVGLLRKRYGDKLGPEADEYIGFAVDGAQRMQGLINDLLAYSRVGTRSGPVERTDLGQACREALANLRTAIEEAGADVQVGPLPEVRADARQMVQLFQNLIGNAVKFHGDDPPTVRVGAEQVDREWRIFVQDNGIGIEPGHQEQIFVIFRRLHAREQFGGSGIGLAICKKIVERHGGRIWVESVTGKGATFWFSLPEGRT